MDTPTTAGRFLLTCAAVGAAGFFGAVARFVISVACYRAFGRSFPVGTMVVNLTGTFFLAWFAAYAAGRTNLSDLTKLAIATGFVGAYTTFSTWAVESNALIEQGAYWRAAANLVGSLLLGLLAVRLGLAMAR